MNGNGRSSRKYVVWPSGRSPEPSMPKRATAGEDDELPSHFSIEIGSHVDRQTAAGEARPQQHRKVVSMQRSKSFLLSQQRQQSAKVLVSRHRSFCNNNRNPPQSPNRRLRPISNQPVCHHPVENQRSYGSRQIVSASSESDKANVASDESFDSAETGEDSDSVEDLEEGGMLASQSESSSISDRIMRRTYMDQSVSTISTEDVLSSSPANRCCNNPKQLSYHSISAAAYSSTVTATFASGSTTATDTSTVSITSLQSPEDSAETPPSLKKRITIFSAISGAASFLKNFVVGRHSNTSTTSTVADEDQMLPKALSSTHRLAQHQCSAPTPLTSMMSLDMPSSTLHAPALTTLSSNMLPPGRRARSVSFSNHSKRHIEGESPTAAALTSDTRKTSASSNQTTSSIEAQRHISQSSWVKYFSRTSTDNNQKGGAFRYSDAVVNDSTLFCSQDDLSSARAPSGSARSSHVFTPHAGSIGSNPISSIVLIKSAPGKLDVPGRLIRVLDWFVPLWLLYDRIGEAHKPASVFSESGIATSSRASQASAQNLQNITNKTNGSSAASTIRDGGDERVTFSSGDILIDIAAQNECHFIRLRLQARTIACVLLMLVCSGMLVTKLMEEPRYMLISVTSACQLVIMRRWGSSSNRLKGCARACILSVFVCISLPFILSSSSDMSRVAVTMTTLLPGPLCIVAVLRDRLAFDTGFWVLLTMVLRCLAYGFADDGHDAVPSLVASLLTCIGALIVSSLLIRHSVEHEMFLHLVYRRVKEANAKVRRARDVAISNSKLKSQVLEQFLANMSHEIRTPLHGIISMTSMARDSRPLTQEQEEYLQTTSSSADTLMLLLNDILDFSKIEAGKMELEQSPFCVPQVIGETVKSMASKAHMKQLEINVQLKDDVPLYAVGDSTRMRQVLCNLVSNAIKFASSGYVLVEAWVQTEVESLKSDIDDETMQRISRSVESPDQVALHICVSDTGIGVPANKRRLIFESFAQGEGSTTTKLYGGTGLGLSISKQLTHLNNGGIWVSDNRNRMFSLHLGTDGSQFHFIWPLQTFAHHFKEHPSISLSRQTLPPPFHQEIWEHFLESKRLPFTLQSLMSRPKFRKIRFTKMLIGAKNALARDCLKAACHSLEIQAVVADEHSFDAILEGHSQPNTAVPAVFDAVFIDSVLLASVDTERVLGLIAGDPDRLVVMKNCMAAIAETQNEEENGDNPPPIDASVPSPDPVESEDDHSIVSSKFHNAMVNPVSSVDLLLRLTKLRSPELYWQGDCGGGKRMMTSSTSDSTANLRNLKILVIDDNQINLKVAYRILSKFGHTPITVDSGAKGIKAFQEQHFDMILLDICMPEMDGFQTARAIRHIERQRASAAENVKSSRMARKRRVPIVAATANALKDNAKLYLQSGMNNYINKPYHPDDLIQLINDTMVAVKTSTETYNILRDS